MAGHRKQEERLFKEHWERTRAIIATSLIPHLKKGTSTDPTKIYPLPWDHEKGAAFIKQDPKEKLKKSLELWEKIDKKTKQE